MLQDSVKTIVGTDNFLPTERIVSQTGNTDQACRKSTLPSSMGSRGLDRTECRICAGACPHESHLGSAFDCSKYLLRLGRKLEISTRRMAPVVVDRFLDWEHCRKHPQIDRKSQMELSLEPAASVSLRTNQ